MFPSSILIPSPDELKRSNSNTPAGHPKSKLWACASVYYSCWDKTPSAKTGYVQAPIGFHLCCINDVKTCFESNRASRDLIQRKYTVPNSVDFKTCRVPRFIYLDLGHPNLHESECLSCCMMMCVSIIPVMSIAGYLSGLHNTQDFWTLCVGPTEDK